MHILIADDDIGTQTELAGRLERWGCQVTVVGDGPSVIRSIGDCPGIDLAILNWMLPGIDGLRIAKALKDAESCAQTLVMVGERFRDQVGATFPLWADGYIDKPLNFSELRELIPQLCATDGGLLT